MAYTRINWQDGESGGTPLSAENLNKMDMQIEQNTSDIASIIESGSNTNGNYIKFADGTMICTKIISGSTGNELELWANGTYYRDIQNGSWAQEFVELYNTQVTNQTLQLWCNIGNITNTSAGITRIIRPDNGGSAGQNYNIQLLAIGRWK